MNIPETIDAAVERLRGIGTLVTAKEWERAAIVAAFVEPGQGEGGKPVSSARISAAEFAKLGIHGLRSHVTVLRYVRIWEAHHDGSRPEPGKKVKLPTTDWAEACKVAPIPNTNTRTEASAVRMASEEPEKLAEALNAEIRGRLEDALTDASNPGNEREQTPRGKEAKEASKTQVGKSRSDPRKTLFSEQPKLDGKDWAHHLRLAHGLREMPDDDLRLYLRESPKASPDMYAKWIEEIVPYLQRALRVIKEEQARPGGTLLDFPSRDD